MTNGNALSSARDELPFLNFLLNTLESEDGIIVIVDTHMIIDVSCEKIKHSRDPANMMIYSAYRTQAQFCKSQLSIKEDSCTALYLVAQVDRVTICDYIQGTYRDTFPWMGW